MKIQDFMVQVTIIKRLDLARTLDSTFLFRECYKLLDTVSYMPGKEKLAKKIVGFSSVILISLEVSCFSPLHCATDGLLLHFWWYSVSCSLDYTTTPSIQRLVEMCSIYWPGRMSILYHLSFVSCFLFSDNSTSGWFLTRSCQMGRQRPCSCYSPKCWYGSSLNARLCKQRGFVNNNLIT